MAAGSHTFQVRATDPAGNTDATPASQTWTIDLTAPDTDDHFGAGEPVERHRPELQLHLDGSGIHLPVQARWRGLRRLHEPEGLHGLAAGSHTFQVRATDPAGNTDPTPASHTWTVDLTAPDTTITGGPTNPSNVTAPSFSFTSTEAGSTFQCSLDGAAFAACTSPKSYTGLTAGSHTFQVRATDPAGNTDLTPASQTWTVDLGAPDTDDHVGACEPVEPHRPELQLHVD